MKSGWALIPALALASACSSSAEEPVAPTKQAFMFDGGGATDPGARLAHGRRLVRLLACQGCHGDNLQGENVTAKDPDFGEMNASNITLLMPNYSDAQLERLIRHGEPKDGRTFWFMASESLQFLADGDLAAIIAYLRTMPPAGKPMPPMKFGPGFRRAQQAGEMEPVPELVARFAAEAPVDLGPQHEYGRWIARAVCAECHDSRLTGYEGYTPDLDMAAVYGFDGLDHLISTGESNSGRDLGMMASTARGRLRLLTAKERKALFDYLLARAEHDLSSGPDGK